MIGGQKFSDLPPKNHDGWHLVKAPKSEWQEKVDQAPWWMRWMLKPAKGVEHQVYWVQDEAAATQGASSKGASNAGGSQGGGSQAGGAAGGLSGLGPQTNPGRGQRYGGGRDCF